MASRTPPVTGSHPSDVIPVVSGQEARARGADAVAQTRLPSAKGEGTKVRAHKQDEAPLKTALDQLGMAVARTAEMNPHATVEAAAQSLPRETERQQLAMERSKEILRRFHDRGQPRLPPAQLEKPRMKSAQAHQIISSLRTQFPHLASSSPIVVALFGALQIHQTFKESYPDQAEGMLPYLGQVLQFLLVRLSLIYEYIDGDDNKITSSSPYRSLLSIEASELIFKETRRFGESELEELPGSGSYIRELYQLYDACNSLFLISPSQLSPNYQLRRNMTIGQIFAGLHCEYEMMMRIMDRIYDYLSPDCKSKNSIQVPLPEELQVALSETKSTWFVGLPQIKRLLKELSGKPSKVTESLISQLFRACVSIYRKIQFHQELSPFNVACQERYNRVGDTDKGSSFRIDSVTYQCYMLAVGLDSLYPQTVAMNLECLMDQRADRIDFNRLQALFHLSCQAHATLIRLVESPPLQQLMQEVETGLLDSYPWYRTASSLLDELKHIAEQGDGHSKPIDTWLEGGINEGRITKLVRGMRVIISRLTLSQTYLRSITAVLSALLDLHHTPELQQGLDDQAINHLLKTIRLFQVIVDFKMVQIRSYSHVEQQCWDVMSEAFDSRKDPSPFIGQLSGQQPVPPAKKKKKKVPQANPHGAPKKEGVERLSASKQESLPESQAAVVAPTPLPTVVMCAHLCQGLKVRYPSAESFLMNGEVFLEVGAEFGKRSSTIAHTIEELDATRRALEWIIRAALNIYFPESEDSPTHHLDQLAYPLFKEPTPWNVRSILSEAWPFLQSIAQANEAIHYPRSSHFKDRQLVDLVSKARMDDCPTTQAELRAVIDRGLEVIQALLKGIDAPINQGEAIDPPVIEPLSKDDLADVASKAESPELGMDCRPSYIGVPEIAIITVDQVRQLVDLFQRMAVIGKDPKGSCLALRNDWFAQVTNYAVELQDVLASFPECWGIGTGLVALDRVRRLVKGCITASLFHHGQRGFKIHENNPRRLVECLPVGVREAIGVPPVHLSYAQEASSRPVRTPQSRGVGPFETLCGALPSLLAVSQAIRETPGQTGYQIGGERVSPQQHQERVKRFTEQILREAIYPGLTYAMSVLREGFPEVGRWEK